MINHRPSVDVAAAEQYYSEKDGVEVKYVCTSAIRENAAFSADIFYRSTPHPKYGNRYFGLFVNSANDLCITAADTIELLTFNMVKIKDTYYYSQHRHDFFTVEDVSIDGGRAYIRLCGNLEHPIDTFKIKNGEFIRVTQKLE